MNWEKLVESMISKKFIIVKEYRNFMWGWKVQSPSGGELFLEDEDCEPGAGGDFKSYIPDAEVSIKLKSLIESS